MTFDLGKGRPPKGGRKAAPLKNSAAPDDPLAGVEYSGDLEKDSVSELTTLQKAYRARASAEANRFASTVDSEFWFAVCFKDRAEKDAFLKAAGVKTKLMGDKYLDGRQLAAALGIKF